MDFKPINTPEEFEAAVSERIAHEIDNVSRKYADYDSLKSKAEEYDTQKPIYERQIGDLNTKIKNYETDSLKTRIALETGLPFEMRTRLKGEKEDEIRKDAQELVSLMDAQHREAPPLKDPEPTVDGKTAAVRALREGLLKGD